MLAGALGPIAQQALHRPLAAAPSPSLLERGRLAARQFEPPAAVERLRALGLPKALVVHEGFMPELSFIIAEEPEIVLAPPTIEIRARALRLPPSTLAEKRSVVRTRRESPRPEPDVQPFMMAVRGLIETERITAARQMLDAAPAYIVSDPVVVKLRGLLAPPVVKRVERRDVDRSQEYRWLRTEGRKYHGRWVALEGDRLLASAPSLRELREALKATPLPRAPLLHRID